jgi:ribosomal protein L37E
MEAVLDYIDCPKCGSEAYDEFHHKTGEEFISCSHCGYNRKFYISNWDEKDDPEMIDTEFEWVPKYGVEEVIGVGAYKIRAKDAIGYQIGSFTDPKGYNEFIEFVENNKDTLAHAEYTKFEDGQLYVQFLILGELEQMDTGAYELKTEEIEKSLENPNN